MTSLMRKRPDAPWQIRYKDPTTGKWSTKSTGCKHRSNAIRALVELERQLESGTLPQEIERAKLTLAEHLSDWESYLDARGNTQRYVDKTIKRVEFLTASLASIKQINDRTITLAIGALKESSSATRDHYRRSAKMFSRWLYLDGRLPADPLAKFSAKGPKGAPIRVRRVLTPEEFQKMLASCTYDRQVVYLLAASTGFRASELRSLRFEDFGLSEDPPVIRCQGTATKNRQAASIPLQAEVAAFVQDWLAANKPAVGGPVLFVPQKSAEMIKADLRRAGIPYRTEAGCADFHSLRNLFITRLAQSSAPLAVVQKLARHSTPALTLNTYAKLQQADQVKAVSALPVLLPFRKQA